MQAIRWRWVAGILWGASGAFGVSRLLSNSFTNIAGYGPVVLILATGLLIAIGGRLGVVVAALATAFTGFVTVVLILMTLSSGCSSSLFCPPPVFTAALALLTVTTFLATREINRAL